MKMYSFYQWICFWLISENTEWVYGSTHAVVGDYKELNPKNCGITRFTNGFDDKCFKWHKTYSPHIRFGRGSTFGEVPWIALIEESFYFTDTRGLLFYSNSTCGGSLFAKRWIISAKHCFKSLRTSDYKVYLGHSPNSRYRAFVEEIHRPPDSDLLVFKLNTTYERGLDINSICLPAPNIDNEKDEYALTAGWGKHDWRREPVQMGPRKLIADYKKYVSLDREHGVNYSKLIFTENLNHSLLCMGDSGGPLWQFTNGRAVLIGTAFFVWFKGGSQCETPVYPPLGADHYYALSTYMRVSLFIDWIKNVTQLQ